jgi:two-component system nitrogen regulation response regulator NtrX
MKVEMCELNSSADMIGAMPAILLVDDDPNFLELLSRFLQQEGYDVKTAANGWEALLVLDQDPIDLILLDVMMPGMDGITFLKIAQSAQRALSAAVIVVTALSSQDAMARTRGLAVAEVVPKSITVFDQVIRIVRRHLPLSGQSKD